VSGTPRVLVVTGTDTGVGKTVVTAALAAVLARTGTVAVLKPAQTGVGPDDPGDVDEVRRLSGVGSVHEGVRLRDPLAPTTAARREGVVLPSVREQAQTVTRLADTHDAVVVEGAGGVLVGLDAAGAGLVGLASHLEVPFAFVVVTRPGLGTLNHTALTTQALSRHGMPVLGLVIGAWPTEPGLAERCNLADLPVTSGLALVGRVPEGAGSWSRPEFVAAAPTWFEPPLVRGRAAG
jgi:dethiobiotin synthetase